MHKSKIFNSFYFALIEFIIIMILLYRIFFVDNWGIWVGDLIIVYNNLFEFLYSINEVKSKFINPLLYIGIIEEFSAFLALNTDKSKLAIDALL